jgi:hypothetical protein
MKLSKQEVIDKILSFNYKELAHWIKARLHGDDRYFPIYEGYETNLSEFLTESFTHIRDTKFRDNFLDILNQLAAELTSYSQDQANKEAEYIYELLSLCGSIKEFENKDTLYEIALDGKLKGIKAYDIDLHQLLLSTLASYHVAGDYKFWVQQMYDDSNKYSANAAFYALLNRGFRLDILFEHIWVFIDRFKGEIDLELGIRALVNDYGKEEIIKRFKGIEEILSREQKEAVNNAFIESIRETVYQLDGKPKREPRYALVSSRQRVGMPTPRYETGTSLKKETAEIFKSTGFDVEPDRVIAGHSIDIFAEKKKNVGKRYKCWLCFCDPGDRKVGKRKVLHLYPIREAVWRELMKKNHDYIYDKCGLMIISEKGFTRGAVEAAKDHKIELKTPDQLTSQLIDFKENHEKLTQS